MRRDYAQKILDKIKTGRVAVLGFGISNAPLVSFLLKYTDNITVYDQKAYSRLKEADEYAGRGVRFVCGKDAFSAVEADVIFRSPGIRPDLPAISEAVLGGALICSEMELFLSMCECLTFGVTGSDGKTTTTTLIHHILEADAAAKENGRHTFVGGNIGEPLLSSVAKMEKDDRAVLELSSFQLMTVLYPVSVAVVTNVTENHLNWHKGMDEYVFAKKNIVKNGITGRLVLNADDAYAKEFAEGFDGEVAYFSGSASSVQDMVKKVGKAYLYCFVKDGKITLYNSDLYREDGILEVSRIRTRGAHNVKNYMAAICATYGYVRAEAVGDVADEFLGVKHRIEPVATVDSVTYFNSSIDSSPARSCVTLDALGGKSVVICGGRNKNLSFDILADKLAERACAVVLTGEAADEIKDAIDKSEACNKVGLTALIERDFDMAFAMASDIARGIGGKQRVVLSPACTSFDAFDNFEHRGEYFKSLVMKLTNKK